MNEAIEEESESDNDKNQEIEKMIRSNSMYGRTYYGENKELGSNAVVSEKLRLYKRTLKLRETQLTKAFKIIRKQQLSNMLNNWDGSIQNSDMLELINNDDIIDDKLHLGVLYASPLGYEEPDGLGQKVFKVIQELDFVNDIKQITSALEGSKNLVNYMIRTGTPINFISVLSRNPHVLHFIGHGIKTEHYGKKEDCLVLENEDGSGQLVSSNKLKMILDVWNSKLDVMFLSSWYSESEAQVCLQAGAKHVVCIQRNK